MVSKLGTSLWEAPILRSAVELVAATAPDQPSKLFVVVAPKGRLAAKHHLDKCKVATAVSHAGEGILLCSGIVS